MKRVLQVINVDVGVDRDVELASNETNTLSDCHCRVLLRLEGTRHFFSNLLSF